MFNTQLKIKAFNSTTCRLSLSLAISMLIGSHSTIAASEDIEVKTLSQAMEFALADKRVPRPEQIKLKEIYATYTNDSKIWQFKFIDGASIHTVVVNDKKQFKIDTTDDAENYNEVFWEDIARAENLIKDDWLEKAQDFAKDNKYTPTKPYIIKYNVCAAPVGDLKSEYSNGCLEQAPKEKWELAMGIAESATGKLVTYSDEKLDTFTNATIKLEGDGG